MTNNSIRCHNPASINYSLLSQSPLLTFFWYLPYYRICHLTSSNGLQLLFFLALFGLLLGFMIILLLVLTRLTFCCPGITHIVLLSFLLPLASPCHGRCLNNGRHICHRLCYIDRATFLCLLWSRNMRSKLHCHILGSDVGQICQKDWNKVGILTVFGSPVCRWAWGLFGWRCTGDIEGGCFSGGIGAEDWSCHSEGAWHQCLCSS